LESFNGVYIYIYAPPWRNNAAGVKILYLLCHFLNLYGCKSWIVLTSKQKFEKIPNHLNFLKIPILTEEIFELHKAESIEPIVVYSETIQGNPLRAKKVIRYFLHYPRALGSSNLRLDSEWKIAYTKSIKDSIDDCEDILYIPAVETEELPKGIEKKSGYYVGYAGKYRMLYGEPALPVDYIFDEVFRDGPRRQTREETLKMLAEAEILFLWENSSIAVEAQLLQTAVVFVPTPNLGPLIADHELGSNGIAMDLSPASIEKALNTVQLFTKDYEKIYSEIAPGVRKIITKSLSRKWDSANIGSDLLFPEYPRLRFWKTHKFSILTSIYREKGFKIATRAVLHQVDFLTKKDRRAH
jgi:hypothetical protein